MRVICLGDSNTYGYDPRSYLGGRYPMPQRWTSRLAARTGWEVICAGENGRMIPRGAQIAALRPVCSQAGLLIVLLGVNDLLQGASPQQIAQRMQDFLTGLQPGRPPVLLVAPPPLCAGSWVDSPVLIQRSQALAGSLRACAHALQIGFADAGAWQVGLCFDGVHFTEAGHQAFADGLCAALAALRYEEEL